MKSAEIERFQEMLPDALKTMGNGYVKDEYKHLWSEENPTLGYCYVITELLHYLVPNSAVKSLPTKEGFHLFLELQDGTILDFAKDQDYDYTAGKAWFFRRKTLSKRAVVLAQTMGISV